MNYLAIVKTVKDIKPDEIHKGLPADYPVECEEFETKELALAKWPDKKIMSVPESYIYLSAMDVIFKHVKHLQEQKPWWKFW